MTTIYMVDEALNLVESRGGKIDSRFRVAVEAARNRLARKADATELRVAYDEADAAYTALLRRGCSAAENCAAFAALMLAADESIIAVDHAVEAIAEQAFLDVLSDDRLLSLSVECRHRAAADARKRAAEDAWDRWLSPPATPELPLPVA